MPKLPELTKEIRESSKDTNMIKNIDGRWSTVKKEYAALNVLLQGTGAIAMKKALVILDIMLQEELGLIPGVDYEFVANVHDEWQIEVTTKYAESVGQAAKEAIQRAGEALGFKCPLDGEYALGASWAETH